MKRIICKRVLLGASLFISALSVCGQQNIQFTQYIFNSLSVNPAYAGYKEEWFGQMALRRQWAGIQDAPQTGQISLDGVLDPEKKRMGLGVQMASDKLGPQTSNSLYLNYAYRLRINDEDTKRLAFGLGVGISQNAVDQSKLTPVSASDQYLPKAGSTDFVPDVRFGIYYYSPKWYVGASAMDLVSGNSKVSTTSDPNTIRAIRHRTHFYLISGLLLDINPEVKLRPSFLIKEDFKGPTSLDLNSMFIFNNKFWIGASYRTGVELWKKDAGQGQVSRANSMAGVVQFYVSDSFRFGYSYDYTMSRLRSIENGSHEISLGITIPRKVFRVISPRFF